MSARARMLGQALGAGVRKPSGDEAALGGRAAQAMAIAAGQAARRVARRADGAAVDAGMAFQAYASGLDRLLGPGRLG